MWNLLILNLLTNSNFWTTVWVHRNTFGGSAWSYQSVISEVGNQDRDLKEGGEIWREVKEESQKTEWGMEQSGRRKGMWTVPGGRARSVPQLCLTHCDPMDCSLPSSFLHWILQARILEWVAMPSSRGSSQPGFKPASSALAGSFFTTELPGKP